MIDEMKKLTGRTSSAFKKKFYGKTFRCPVCHLELSHHDLDHNGLVVCPLCGVVMEVTETYGHSVPVVHDVELYRPQPKARIHPWTAHIPIGLFPVAVLGALLLMLLSIGRRFESAMPVLWTRMESFIPLLANAVLILLFVSVVGAIFTFASGFWDWKHRYRGRPYRVISLKLVFSGVFVVVGATALVLHGAGLVFQEVSGLVDFSSPQHLAFCALYFVLLLANIVVMATLGHVGGNLVFGK